MAKTKIHVGLEIGTSKTCMVVGEVKPDATVTIIGVGEVPVSYTHLRAHETRHDLVCRLLLEKKKKDKTLLLLSLIQISI